MNFIKNIVKVIIHHDSQYSFPCIITSFFLTMISLFKRLISSPSISINSNTRQPPPSLPPGPSPYPVLGCLPQMLNNRPAFRWIHQLMREMNTEIACVRLGRTQVITVTSPEIAREFLLKQDRVFCSRPICTSNRLTSGYLTAALSPVGDQWKKMRRVLASHVLSPAKHRWQYKKRCGEADHLVKFVHRQCTSPSTDGVVDVRVASRHYSGNVIRKLIFGKRFFGSGAKDGGPGLEEEEHVQGLFMTLTYLFGFGVSDFVPWLEVFDVDGHKRILEDAVKSATKYQDPEIEERVRMWAKGFREEEEDVLDVLINLRDERGHAVLSVEEIKAQVMEMMIAAIDNPSNAVEWALAEMINRPEILLKAQTELDRVVGKSRLVKESDIQALNYVKACAREAFRLHPTSPFNVPRVSTEDTVVSGYFIPKGSTVLLSRPGLGRNPRVWKDPLRFDPDRHVCHGDNNGNVSLTDNELNLLSFSTGRRGCIGVGLGTTMTVMLLARLVHSFDWATPDDEGVDLAESKGALFMARALKARAFPRLEESVYVKVLEEEL